MSQHSKEAHSKKSHILNTVQDVAVGVIAERASRVDAERGFPSDNCEALATAEAFGLLVPLELGGAGGGLPDLVVACEAIGQACASTGMIFLMHSVAVATVSGAGGDRADQLLQSMAQGAIGTLAFSEQGSGAHFYSPELHPVSHNGTVKISGRKSFVTSGAHADIYLALVQSNGQETDCYAIDARTEGVSFDGHWNGLGMTGNSSVAMELDNVVLDTECRIGELGDGTSLVFNVVAPCFLIGLASLNVGIAAAAAAAATEHVKNRVYPDGSSLAEIQIIQHSLADMDMLVRQARLLVYEASRLGECADESALISIMEAKVTATVAAVKVTQKALEVCGGRAYTQSLPFERHLRDAHAGAVMAPTNAVLRNWIGKALVGLPVP